MSLPLASLRFRRIMTRKMAEPRPKVKGRAQSLRWRCLSDAQSSYKAPSGKTTHLILEVSGYFK